MAETFTWDVSIGSGSESKARIKKAQFGDGYAQRTGDGLNPILQTWPVTIKAKSLAEADAIEAFLEARAGVEAFTWTPTGASAPISVVCESWSRRDRVASSAITASFERVFEP